MRKGLAVVVAITSVAAITIIFKAFLFTLVVAKTLEVLY